MHRKIPCAKEIRSEEQRRLACDLHDECGVFLATLQCKMETLKHHFPQNPIQFQEQADQMIDLLTRLSDNLRSIFTWLSPIASEEFGLVRTPGRSPQDGSGQ